jgi:hypothetical protein
MRRLPNVDALVAQVKDRAVRDMEKVAGTTDNSPTYTTSVASAMYKLAQCLRATDAKTVTYSDLYDFSKQLIGKTCNL